MVGLDNFNGVFMRLIFFSFISLIISPLFAASFEENQGSICEEPISYKEVAYAATSYSKWIARNCVEGFCTFVDFVDRHPSAAQALSIFSSCQAAAAQVWENRCMDMFDNESDCVANCCGWCRQNNVCMYGNYSGPNDENWDECPDLSTWNWTGQNCPHLSNTAGWLIAAGLTTVLFGPPVYKIWELYCRKRSHYDRIQ